MAEAQGLARIAPYVSNLERDVFAVYGLPEEVIAVLFAYYSRSRDDLRTNLARLVADDDVDVGAEAAGSPVRMASDKARAFHEKWVVGYGHASVAEHAVVHLAIENVSILASKAIEDARLASYTEKSTRYVVFDTKSFVDLPELPEPLRRLHVENGERLFRTYLDLLPKVDEAVRARVPRQEGQTERGWAAAVRATTCDLLRGLLPASTRTNLGLTANARSLEGCITKLLSSPLAEVRGVGEAMLREGSAVSPTLLKYAGANAWRRALPGVVASHAGSLPLRAGGAASSGVRLLRWDRDALSRVALALAVEQGGPIDAVASLDALAATGDDALLALVRATLEKRGKFDGAPRAFEATGYTVEVTCDYGAYRDMQRHRMLTPANERLGCALGAEVPPELEEMGVAAPFREALDRAAEAWETIAREHPLEAQYAVPLAYRVRTLWTLSLRELFHVVELRSARQGHPSYRRIAQQLHEAAAAVHPWLEGMVRVDREAYSLTRPV